MFQNSTWGEKNVLLNLDNTYDEYIIHDQQ